LVLYTSESVYSVFPGSPPVGLEIIRQHTAGPQVRRCTGLARQMTVVVVMMIMTMMMMMMMMMMVMMMMMMMMMMMIHPVPG
jgi:hypothetical protein